MPTYPRDELQVLIYELVLEAPSPKCAFCQCFSPSRSVSTLKDFESSTFFIYVKEETIEGGAM